MLFISLLSCCRHNPRWGRHAPTRFFSKRSISDPDIMQSLEKEELERRGLQKRAEDREDGGLGEDEWEREDDRDSHFRPIHYVASAYNIPHLILQQQAAVDEPELTFLAEEEVTGSGAQQNLLENSGSPRGAESLPERGLLVHSTPVDKSKNLQHFLASLPVVVGSTDDGIGENIPTSNSGSAYSSPIYTPPDEDSILMRMASQPRHQEEATGAVGSGSSRDAGEERERVAGDEEACRQKSGESQPPLPSSSSPRLSPSQPGASSPPTARDKQQQQLDDRAIMINGPVSSSHRSYSLPYGLSSYVFRTEGTTTTPSVKKPTSSSPTNGRGVRVSGLVRQSPVSTTSEEEGEGRKDHRRQGSPSTGTPLKGDIREVQSEEELEHSAEKKWQHGDVALESLTPRTREKFFHHRRTKSDSHHDTSGPIKTTQISSVPERVKEIEEKGLQVTSTQSLQSIIHQADTQLLYAASSDSRSSSEECLSTPFADTGPGERGQTSTLQHVASTRPAIDSVPRHLSLSPKPSLSSCVSTSSSSPHIPVQTSSSLPSGTTPLLASTSPPPPPPQPTDVDLTSSLTGVVKAKVQNFEGKKGAQPQSEFHSTGSDTVVKRTLVQSGQRPHSEIIFHTPYVGMVEVNDPSDSESQTSTSSSTRELDGGSCGGGSSGFQTHHRSAFSSLRGGQEGGSGSCGQRMGRRSTAGDIFSSSEEKQDSRGSSRTDKVQSGAVFNAWVGIIPREELQANDLASVLELKQKFERENPKDPGRRLQQLSSLRRSRSLRDTRLPSPPVRLGGSARWKKFSSNASLQRSGERQRRVCASASPTSSGSQQSLSSSGKT